MEWKKDTAADIVVGAAAKIAEDMVQGTVAAVRDIARYSSMYKNMAASLDMSAQNLQNHIAKKKWASKESKKEIRMRINQIKSLSKICSRLNLWCAAFAGGAMREMEALEKNQKLEDIVDSIEFNNDIDTNIFDEDDDWD